jgi:mRNA interferase MazF
VAGYRRQPPEPALVRSERCVISCDNVITVPIEDLDEEPAGRLDEVRRAALEIALRFALDIVY